MKSLLATYGDRRVEEAVELYRSDYGRNGLYRSVAYPGIARALRELRVSGAGVFLATSKRTRFARRILDHLGLTVLFDGVYGSEEGGSLDHKPELVAHIVKHHALKQSHCVMVGDRRQDVIGAHANNMRALGVLWGYGSRSELEVAGADGLVSDPAGLPIAALALTTLDMK